MFTITNPNDDSGVALDSTPITITRNSPIDYWCGDVKVMGFYAVNLTNPAFITLTSEGLYPSDPYDWGSTFIQHDGGTDLFAYNEESVTFTADLSSSLIPMNEYKIGCWYRLFGYKTKAIYFNGTGGGDDYMWLYCHLGTTPGQHLLSVGDKFHISGSANNDGVYTVSGLSDSGDFVYVEESFTAGMDLGLQHFQSASDYDQATYGNHYCFGKSLMLYPSEYQQLSEVILGELDGGATGIRLTELSNIFIGEDYTVTWENYP